MQQSIIAARVGFGLSRAAGILGTDIKLFRPTTATRPVSGDPLMTLYGEFDVSALFAMRSTERSNDSFVSFLGDPNQVQVGDYLVGRETHFVARVEPLRPALCVLCDQVVNVLSTVTATAAGTNAYGGRTDATDTLVAEGWPVSMMARGRVSSSSTKLPSDTRTIYYEVLMPPVPGLTLSFGMRLQDSDAQEYEVTSAELSPFGWKLLVGLATT